LMKTTGAEDTSIYDRNLNYMDIPKRYAQSKHKINSQSKKIPSIICSSGGKMSGNGGHPSSIQAARNGTFQPDRGRLLVANPMEDNMEEDFFCYQ